MWAGQVAILKKTKAENVVRFVGVCITKYHTLLVTEFMENGDLYAALGIEQRREELSWYNR